MAKIRIAMCGPQDPIYGIYHSTIVARLTRNNWRKKAVVRVDDFSLLYIWITKDPINDDDGKLSERYVVHVTRRGGGNIPNLLSMKFLYLGQATAYANGEDEGLLATTSKPTESLDALYEEVPPVMITFIPNRQKLKSRSSSGPKSVPVSKSGSKKSRSLHSYPWVD